MEEQSHDTSPAVPAPKSIVKLDYFGKGNLPPRRQVEVVGDVLLGIYGGGILTVLAGILTFLGIQFGGTYVQAGLLFPYLCLGAVQK